MATIVHGTPSTYTNHKCRCGDCRRAWASYCRAYRTRLRGTYLPAGDSRHGVNGYTNYGCRCQTCRDLMSAYQRTLRTAAAS